MNEYEECLYCYIMDNKFGEIYRRPAYRAAKNQVNQAMKALTETFTGEQKELFDSYMDRECFVNSLEFRFIFRKALSLAKELYLS